MRSPTTVEEGQTHERLGRHPVLSQSGVRDRGSVMFTIHATRKLRDRVNPPTDAPVAEPTTALGNWYATALFWKPQLALFVNERTLLPVFVPLAPARTVAVRFPPCLEAVLNALGTDPRFVAAEVAAMVEPRWARTANRSVVGVMNEFTSVAELDLDHDRSQSLTELAVRLAGTPCGPLYKSHTFPDQELAALVAPHLP
jgi:hypothetical protein